MELSDAASALKELGHPTRLNIFKRLVRSGPNGLAVGTLQADLQIPSSTLSHHISALVSAELVSQVRDGRTLFCRPNLLRLKEVIGFLQFECCKDHLGDVPTDLC